MSDDDIIIDSMTDSEIDKFTRGTKTLLVGFPGTGKTDALTTFLQADIPLRVIGTDPGFEESILDAVRRRGLESKLDLLNYMYVSPAVQSFTTLREVARQANVLPYSDLATLKNGIQKADYQQFLALLDALNNFKCDRTGKELGPVDEWPKNVCLGLDSLTGVNKMAMQNHVGGKPTLHEGEWNVAMNTEENLIHTMCSNLKCFVVVTAHVQKNFNEVTGEIEFATDALGRKLGPRLPYMFSDFVVAEKHEKEFSWSTMAANFNNKNRALPMSAALRPNFDQIVEVWKKRNELVATRKTED